MSEAKPARAARLDELRETFGDRQVAEGERKREVNELFDRIAPRYDLMNDLMSFGTHRMWKSVTVREALRQLEGKTGPLVDLAGGTGDLALAIKERDPARQVIVADASAGMLEQARERGEDRLGVSARRCRGPAAGGQIGGGDHPGFRPAQHDRPGGCAA